MTGRIKIIDMVRNYAAANSIVRKKQIAKDLDLTAIEVGGAVNTMVSCGQLKRVGRGTYEYIDQPSAKCSPIKERIWRGMTITPKFSCSELARLAETTMNYVSRVVGELKAEGYVEPAGTRETFSGKKEKLWRVTGKGKSINRPKTGKLNTDPMVKNVVTLNRLISTGMVKRLPDERDRALELCREIEAALMEITDPRLLGDPRPAPAK